jgi:hypothetical protein
MRNLRDAIDDLKRDYERLWLRANTPYRLGTVLSLYDIEMQYWHGKSRLMEELRARGKPVPAPESVGLVLP